MAEITAFRNNALPYPVYSVPYTVVFPLLDADGDPVTGETCDSEVSKNGDTAVDCTNEGTEIPFTTATNKGMYYLTLTAAEMTADIVAVTIYAANSKATPIVLYPRKLVTLASGTSQGGAVGYITLAASTVDFDGQFNGCLCVATIDSNVEARILQACTTADQQCTVTPNWNVAPDADDTYVIYLPEGMQISQADVRGWLGVAPLALSSQQVQAVVPDTQKVDLNTIKTQTITCAAATTFGVYVGGTAAHAIASLWTEARAGALTDWIDEGRLDLLLDAIPTTAMRGTEGANTVVPPTVAQLNARTLPTASYATAAICTEVRLATLTDWINGGRLDLILDATLAMLDDARAEPGQGAPAVNADAMTKLDYLYKAWRNLATQTATEYALYNDAGAVVDQKAPVSDDNTTLTRGEIETGP